MTFLQISNQIVVRKAVEKNKNYIEYKDDLRVDFWYSCAYCNIMENESKGIGFEIDHYYPKKRFPEKSNEYENLMWSCEKCNRFKGSYYADDNALKNGNYVLRPDECDPSEHYEIERDFLKSTTHTGEFNIQLLNLNRLQLRRIRQFRRRLGLASKTVIKGVFDLRNYSIDKIKTKYRYEYLKSKENVERYCSELDKYRDILVENIAKSELLDEDPDTKKRTQKRRKFLKTHMAITHETIPLMGK